MLSTPPAFILSQDQTLMFNVDPSSRSTSFFILVITVLIKNVRWFFLKSSEKFIRIFKVVLLFSCQRTFLWSASCVQEALLFYHSSFYLSRTFLIYFVDPFFIRTAATFKSYHVLSCLSSLFSKVFLGWNIQRRRRDLNPRAAINDLHPFQGCPFNLLGTSPDSWFW